METGGLVESLVALLTLTSLEVVLGIDNIVFIAIVAGKLPESQRNRARLVGLSLAVFTRLLLLFTLTWLASLTAPWFSLFGQDFSGRDLILIGGGVFLIWKATLEIHSKTEGKGKDGADIPGTAGKNFVSTIIQILLIDIVFSLDSVITAVGMTNNILIMSLAVVLAVIFMLIFSGGVVNFVDKHPTVKMLALAFLLLIGFVLVLEGFGKHVEKAYIYFAMGFSLGVEMLNLRELKKAAKSQG